MEKLSNGGTKSVNFRKQKQTNKEQDKTKTENQK